MGDIELDEYMAFDAEWEQYDGESKYTNMPKYKPPVNIKCMKYGKTLYIRESIDGGKVNAQTYLVTDDIKVRDKIDGQVIKDRAEYPVDFEPGRTLYECYTW